MPFAGLPLAGWPVFWELLAGVGFLFCYSALALSYLLPAKVKEGSAQLFARSAARFLAHATTADHVDFASEVRNNMEPVPRVGSSQLSRLRSSAPATTPAGFSLMACQSYAR